MAIPPSPQKMSLEASLYLFYHVFLPPNLPQAEDYNPKYECVLLDKVIDALRDFSGHVSSQYAGILTMLIRMVVRMRSIYGFHGDVSEAELIKALAELDSKGGFLPVYVRDQNAAILLTRSDDAIHVESFELSPRNEPVMTTVGRLQRVFPGPTLALDLATFNEPGLRESIAQTLAQMSHQHVAGTKPKVNKAGQKHDEDRDTTHPKMVTEFIMAILRPRCADADTLQIQKNTREEVMWRDSRSPWRRSALWLLVRVTLQLAFRRLSSEERTDDLYKHFMIFFMSSVVDTSPGTMSSENIYLMNAKIARRLLKLSLPEEPAWFASVQRISRRASDIIHDRWRQTMARNNQRADMHSLESLDFDQDIYCTLPDLDRYLEGIKRRGHRYYQFRADYQPRSKLVKYQATELPAHLDFADIDYRRYNLAAFEEWVAWKLDIWLHGHLEERATCSRLGELMTVYHHAASSLYSRNPEAVSVMLLTLLELWIACDKSAIHIHGTLNEYDPCIPADTFQSLLLPFKSQMVRLARAEKYLHQRQQNLIYHGPAIFRDFGTASCFSVRYFDQSDDHQRLYREVEDHANRERMQKKSELWEKQQRCKHLKGLAKQTECTYNEVVLDRRFDFRESRHSPSCPRCRYESMADSIDISIHEWPLPSDHLQAKSTIFELSVPWPFGGWRDTTVFFLLTVLGVKYASQERPRAQYRLQTYRGLSSFLALVETGQRIGLLSQNKPHEGTHRRKKLIINVTESDICLRNGLHFQYFDNIIGCFVDGFKTTLDTEIKCTYHLPQQSSSLQQFLFRPAKEPNGPSPNTVIATQFAAPKDMSLEEYKSLATMPLGVEIQWQNILLELSAPSVDFKKAETGIFFLQVINQAGPSRAGTHLRQGHMTLSDQGFAIAMLARVEEVTERIKENWDMVQGLNGLIFLVLRMLSLSPFSDIYDLCLHRLGNLRQIAFHWVKLVREKANQTVDDTRRANLIAKSAHIALVCTETFNVENLVQIFAGPADVSVFIQCCMMIHDWEHSLSMDSNPLLPILYHRWQNLTYRSHPILANNIVHQRCPGLDLAIQEAWAAYRSRSTWSTALSGDCHWLVARTACQSAHDAGILVHINLLTGKLLVNGLPLARLPSDHERHPTYRRLFGQSQLEVMPSDSPGMEFSCQKQYMAHTIHLGRERIPDSTDSDLSVKAVKDDRVWEFVPPRLLAGCFPDAFVENYTHWYAIDGGYVEFRPARTPWLSSSHNWRLQRNPSQNFWYLEKQGTFLVSVKSQTAKLISNIFRPVEKYLKLHCSLHAATSTLDIDIPRLRLEFSLRPQCSSIRSRQYPGMSIDAEQSIGSLVGLRDKLLLIHANAQDRVLIIPEGTVSWERNCDHVDVKIGWQSETKLHAYSVDAELGRLVDNGSLQSKLLLSYLHALTSFCLPDPLTKKTGTEQALSILRSASIKSFDQLQPEHMAVLGHIAALTPERRYYPENERVMQSVRWQNGLGFLSHHSGFYEEVAAVFDQDRRMRFFNLGTEPEYPSLPHVEGDLLRRDRIRASSFRVSGFGADDYTREYDCRYKGLDHTRKSVGGSRVFALCKMLYNEIPRVRNIEARELIPHLWKFLSQPDLVHGPDIQVNDTTIGYDARFILEPGNFIAMYWCSIHQLICSRTPRFSKFRLMIWLSTMAFSNNADMIALEIIASLFVVPEMASVSPPVRVSFRPGDGYQMDRGVLRGRIQLAHLSQTPESRLVPERNETYGQFKSRKKWMLKRNRALVLERMIIHLESQWPIRSPSYPVCQGDPKLDEYLDMRKAMASVQERFAVWCDNGELRHYLTDLTNLLSRQRVQTVDLPPYFIPHHTPSMQQRREFVCLDDLLGFPPGFDIPRPQLRDLLRRAPEDKATAPHLLALVESLGMQAKSNYEVWYVQQLQSSVASLQEAKKATHIELDTSAMEEAIIDYLSLCQEYAQKIYLAILSQVSPSMRTDLSAPRDSISVKVSAILAGVGQWPRLSPIVLLEQLSRYRWHRLPADWKRYIIIYGCSITTLQRAKRLANLINNHDELMRELQNPGHATWEPFEFPESLLLEIENGILIRNAQEETARQMRKFGPGENGVMQLNMGEGKSSVIVPIVAAALANGSRLVRVLVAKPQSRQMFQMLVSKLGGLLGRRVYHMPVSRSLKFGKAEADEIERMCRECMLEGGVLLIQPEHILSLKLMCLECFIVGKATVGSSLLRTLQFFQTCSRDVVDESDENFNVKFELIYTMGAQCPVELSPQRWILIQKLLGIVRIYAANVKDEFPQSIEVHEQQLGGFPRIRLLRHDAEKALFERIAAHICDNGIDSLPISRQIQQIREAVLNYAVKPDLTAEEIAAVENNGPTSFWTESTRGPLLLLRGLLAGGVLAFCLGQKRWRVNYGPDLSRDPPTRLCVPYRAKDNPSPRSEFSHPDVVILLTSLNYYYAGLDNDDLFLAFNHLAKSDQADTEYQAWVNDASTLPHAYRQLVGVNLDDQHHCTDCIFPALRFSKAAIDYFLAQIVFPKEIKEFPDKLSASGWDIGEIKANPTVGFSGTNDSRKTLPLSVRQLDLPEQNHTNALVLEYLLQPENSVVCIPDQDEPSKSDAQLLLDLVSNLDPPAQVILDVGAQILELSNLEMAGRWLEMLPKEGPIQAVVFVNDTDEICVVDRNGRVELLQVSHFARRMEACFVFLDEAHTRGIDLKLPFNYRAAVTLGPGITKDKLVQACMRMRKLGNGQSVVFCIPKEIQFKILGLSGKDSKSAINVSDVLCWAVSETWIEVRRSIPLWAAQGKRFERQQELWHNGYQGDSTEMTLSQAERFLEPEAQTLEHRYRPGHGESLTVPSIPDGSRNLRLILDRCHEFDNLDFTSSTLQEEQERELAPEIERERQVQRPPEATPEDHRLHPHLRSFVTTGKVREYSDAYKPAFQALGNTSAASFLDVSQFPFALLATKDFASTVQMPRGSRFIADAFQRPVRWILTSTDRASPGGRIAAHMMAISPYEANHLLPEIRQSKSVTLHLYKPRQNQGFSPLDKLTLYNVPRDSGTIEIPDILRIELNLFAGQLYLESYSEYLRLCDFLGVASAKTPDGLVVASDGFIVSHHEGSKTNFRQSPLKFIKVLMSQIRKDCQEIEKTHIGQIVDGRLLCPSDFVDPLATTMTLRTRTLEA